MQPDSVLCAQMYICMYGDVLVDYRGYYPFLKSAIHHQLWLFIL